LRDLLAPQSGCAAAAAAGQADIVRLEPGAASAQEISQLLTPASAVAGEVPARAVTVELGLGGDIYYQDKFLSCTWMWILAHWHP
jgi:hypothetical protein